MPREHEGPRLPMGLPTIRREDAAAARQDVQRAITGYPDRGSFIQGTISTSPSTRTRETMFLKLSLTAISRGMGIDRLGERRDQDRERAEEFDFGAAYGYRFVQSLREKGYPLPEVTTLDHMGPVQRKEASPRRDIRDIGGIMDDVFNPPPQGSEPLDFTLEAMLAENPALEESVTALAPMEQQGFRAVYTLIRNQYISDQVRRAVEES